MNFEQPQFEDADNEKYEAGERRKEICVVEIGGQGYEIPVEISFFGYPEHIQKDTEGVIGYERRQISWEDLEEQYPEGDYIHFLRKKKTEGEDLNTTSQIEEDLRVLLGALSDGAFPKKTYNHLVGRSKTAQRNLIERSKEEKLTTQKIFNPETFIHLSENRKIGGTSHAQLVFLNVEDNEEVATENVGDIGSDLFEKPGLAEDLKKYHETPSVYAASDRGLSVSRQGEFWEDQDVLGWGLPPSTRDAPELMIYGFGEENKAFHNYLKKVKQILSEIIDEDRSHKGLMNPSRQLKTVDHLLGEKEVEHFDVPESEEDHPWIPAINGHPDVPDLRWCHADWAYIPTQNGLNVLHFLSEELKDEDVE